MEEVEELKIEVLNLKISLNEERQRLLQTQLMILQKEHAELKTSKEKTPVIDKKEQNSS
jgi:hypothetical protein